MLLNKVTAKAVTTYVWLKEDKTVFLYRFLEFTFLKEN